MTTVQNQHAQVPPVADDGYYADDDAGYPHSPQLQQMTVNFEPSPTPPLAVPLPAVSPDSTPPGSPNSDRKASHKPKVRPSQSDAVLIDFMGGGKYSETARKAGNEPLASDPEDEETTMNGTHVEFNGEKAESEQETTEKDGGDKEGLEKEGREKDDLASVAARAMNIVWTAKGNSPPTPTQATLATKPDESKSDARRTEGEPMEDVKPTIPSITATLVDPARSLSSPEAVKLELKPPVGELPPIRHSSPRSALSNGNGGPITLPSITDQLGDISHIPDPVPSGNSPFAQSPPGRPPPQFAAVPGHGSPPKSPNEYRRELPSPGRGAFYGFGPGPAPLRRQSQTEGHQYSSAGEYSSSNTETPSTDQSGATPAIDRMSIDGITNPQIGGFQCTYPGCTAQPFQTQYLLNSHANVHSSNRPHYCGVKGCPRSEGGKGFKRKNEMIRHGLVHDSPGYVCPFCPDREHKYPRPDNLQRHVRVHHVDKDKDDAQLREVLSQRPEGPSRGRRRRGGTS
ncbi:Metallothionein expression activator [Lachnellula suecica]|uniref:Metallothionein expression activator n=1 Tax=Lachnellula suecica TaxID=602035 RepID=A0A8T9BYV2_9HELO|nr:Metallothionein expression activator [Lachnellula suecica]